jgi:hypothetical protein
MKNVTKSGVAAGVLVAVLAAGCDTNPEPVTVFCSDFSVGSDFSKETFGVQGSTQKPYVAFAQAVSDMAVTGSTLLGEVDAACRDLAYGFGANPSDPRLVGPVGSKVEASSTKDACQLAAQLIASKRSVLVGAKVSMWFASPGCRIDATELSQCEARCSEGVACVEPPWTTRCKPADRVGTCSGRCTGACEGSEDATAACDGTCTGSCDGTCTKDGAEVRDFVSGSVCSGRCSGRCGAACTFAEGTPAICDATCRGGCEGTLDAAKCAGDLEPPKCAGDSDCQACCTASAAARASCKGGAVGVVVASPVVDPLVASMVQALERNLPILLLTARGRGEVLRKHASTLVDAAGHLLGRDDLGREGAACGILIAQTGVAASDNMTVSLEGARHVASAVEASLKR